MKQVGYAISFVVIIYLTACGDILNNRSTEGESALSTADSIGLFTNRIIEDSSDYKLFLQRSKLYLNSGQIDPAFRDVSRALEIDQNDPDTYIVLSDIYFIIGKLQDATAALKKAIDLEPENIDNVLKLARTYIIIRDVPNAERYVEYALSLNVDNAEAYYLKGVAKLENGDSTEALTNMKIAGNLDTTFYIAYMHLGSLLSNHNQQEAIGYYKQALGAEPNDERAMFYIARLYQEIGEFDKSLEFYDKLIEVHPGNQNVFYNRGFIYLVEKQEFDAAIESFETAITIDPGYFDAVYNLGRAYEAKEMYAEARLQYRQVLDIRTNYPLAIEALNRLDKIQYPD